VKVELVAPDGGPLTVVDQKGKKQKYQVYAREGYVAPKGGVAENVAPSKDHARINVEAYAP